MLFIRNPETTLSKHLSAIDRATFGLSAPSVVRSYLQSCPRHAFTPLRSLASLASQLGCAGIFVKDEGHRLGLGSFKALGGAYAVVRLVVARAERELGYLVDPKLLRTEPVAKIARELTVACATDGNHGRSVAAGAALANCRSVVFVHEGVSDERVASIEALGSETVRVPGRYDDSVRVARRVSEERGWELVSDTSWDGYHSTPRTVMQGYTVVIAEALEQLDALSARPTHVILQAGVGGFAAAISAYLSERFGTRGPTILIVEPDRADCVLESIRAGRPVRLEARSPTIMSMLECYEPSHVALQILRTCANAFMGVPDELAVAAMRRYALPSGGDPPILSGESGAAGLAGLLGLADNRLWRQQLNLDSRSTVLLVNTETATDASRYRSLVGLQPQSVSRELPYGSRHA
jgi:diaminopropionate ammonia-lyase